jgi:carboxypeptidase T
MLRLILITILSLSFAQAHMHDLQQDKLLVTFKLTAEVKNYLQTHELDVTGVNVKEGFIQALLTQNEYEKLASTKAQFLHAFPQSLLRAPDPEYQNPQEIEAHVKRYANEYPELTKLVEVGNSIEGRKIWAIKISDNADQRETSEPVTMFNSMHHAREVMTPEISLDIIDYLLTRYNSDEKVRHWVDSNEIWIIPMFNVDGNNRMWTQDSMWRKNARESYGVDLNRNYPVGWNSCNGSSGSRFSQTYRGTSAASEPETQAMMRFVSDIKPVFNISYHSYSELVLYPYGCSPSRTATREVVEAIGSEMGRLLNYTAGTPWELLYNADGGDIDWMYQSEQVIPFVIEVNASSQGFHPDYSEWRDKTVVRNRAGWQYLLDRLDASGIRGQIAPSQNQVTIEVKKAGAVFMNYKVNPDGTYHIVVPNGEYELIFKGGNQPSEVKKVSVNNKLIRL